ncbi:MAG: hypothetical protein AAGL10_12990 [Pseudomonadota bacterium]
MAGKINFVLAQLTPMKRPAIIPSIFVCMATVALGACDDSSTPVSDEDILTTDPVISRALNDPLMIDPDLAWINEANAVIAYNDSHALPAFAPDKDAAGRARDAARIELREDGTIEELPSPESLADDSLITDLSTFREILDVAGAPANCVEGASDDLGWAAKMPDSAQIMPHGMVQQAAGSDGGECFVRVIRYLSQADTLDVLQYHYTNGKRAKLEMSYKKGASELIKGERAGEKMVADIANSPSGLRLVTLVHWRY